MSAEASSAFDRMVEELQAVNTPHETLDSYQRQDREGRMGEEVARRAGDLMRQGYH